VHCSVVVSVLYSTHCYMLYSLPVPMKDTTEARSLWRQACNEESTSGYTRELSKGIIYVVLLNNYVVLVFPHLKWL